MGFTFDVTAASQISKEIYTPKDVDTFFFKSPTVGLMPKWTDGGGLDYVGALGNAILTSESSIDAIAFTAGSASSYERFVLTWKEGFASANLTGMAIDMTRNERGALTRAIVKEMDNAYKALGVGIGRRVFGNGGGAIGLVNGSAATTTTVTGDTVVLKNPSQGILFQKNMVINSASTDGTSGSVHNGGVTLVSVDRIKGILVANQAWTTGIPGFTVNDYLFNQGDFGNYGPGLAAWIPDANNRPASTDSFYNVNRSTDPIPLAGVYIAGNSAPMEETLIDAVTYSHQFGGTPTHCILNPKEYSRLSKSLTGRVQYTTETAYGNPSVGFPGVKIQTPSGPLTLIQDSFCTGPSYNPSYLVDFKDWVMPSMGNLPKNLTEELTSLVWVPKTGSNAFISMMGYRYTQFCADPGHQCSIVW